MSSTPSIVALIPARAGSKRVQNKNIRRLNGHPLLAYSIVAAQQSGVFSAIVVSTDSEEIAAIARYYGATVPFLRPKEYAADKSPDIEWLHFTLNKLAALDQAIDAFALLRPTSPFRQPSTIKRAWMQFQSRQPLDSIRAVELVSQHPGKMWVVQGERMWPLLLQPIGGVPWHSTPYQALPPVYIQNASLEIAWSRVVLEGGSIAGQVVAPFITEGEEGYDINVEYDWQVAERMLAEGRATLPVITLDPYPTP
jgi:CMP-N-acetylneuraminic acid synthetase